MSLLAKAETPVGKNIQENKDAPENVFDDTREVFGGIFGLAGGDGDGFRSTICFFFHVNLVFGMSPLLEKDLHAKAAVTKTDANPPIPSWKGAPGSRQFSPPM